MHGFHLGSPALQELLERNSTPDIYSSLFVKKNDSIGKNKEKRY